MPLPSELSYDLKYAPWTLNTIASTYIWDIPLQGVALGINEAICVKYLYILSNQ